MTLKIYCSLLNNNVLKLQKKKKNHVGLLFFSSTYFSHAMSYHLHCSILKADSERVSYQQCLGINYSSIIWKRNNSLKDPFSLSDGDYPMVWKWLSCKCFGTNHSKVSRHLWSKVSWKQWLLIPTSLGSTVFLNEKQRRGQGWEHDFSAGLKEMTEVQWKLWGLAAQSGFTVSNSGIRSHLEVMVSILPVLRSCQTTLQSCLSKWCWWELWWFSFSWCLLWDCTAQIMVPSITWAALGYKRQEANKIYGRSMPFWRGTWESSGII